MCVRARRRGDMPNTPAAAVLARRGGVSLVGFVGFGAGSDWYLKRTCELTAKNCSLLCRRW
eukprot:2718377-Pleurochrysis_carterae.AAC.1